MNLKDIERMLEAEHIRLLGIARTHGDVQDLTDVYDTLLEMIPQYNTVREWKLTADSLMLTGEARAKGSVVRTYCTFAAGLIRNRVVPSIIEKQRMARAKRDEQWGKGRPFANLRSIIQ